MFLEVKHLERGTLNGSAPVEAQVRVRRRHAVQKEKDEVA